MGWGSTATQIRRSPGAIRSYKTLPHSTCWHTVSARPARLQASVFLSVADRISGSQDTRFRSPPLSCCCEATDRTGTAPPAETRLSRARRSRRGPYPTGGLDDGRPRMVRSVSNQPWRSPKMADTAIWNFRQLAHHELDGFGGIGEGMSIQIAKDGRRILWLAHESAPKNFTAVDVSDPRAPKIVARADLPQSHMRSNSLETVGDIMAVAYQTKEQGLQPAGFELFDISVPENPRSICFFDCSGPHSRGVHQLWFADGEYIHMSSGSPDFTPTHPKDDQFYRIIDVKNPSKPVEVGRWWLPGTRQGDSDPPPARHPEGADTGFRPHNTNVYPERPDRAYLGYIDGGMVILDISDKARPKMISRWDYHPPYFGFTHTVVPFFDRNLLIVSDECVRM